MVALLQRTLSVANCHALLNMCEKKLTYEPTDCWIQKICTSAAGFHHWFRARNSHGRDVFACTWILCGMWPQKNYHIRCFITRSIFPVFQPDLHHQWAFSIIMESMGSDSPCGMHSCGAKLKMKHFNSLSSLPATDWKVSFFPPDLTLESYRAWNCCITKKISLHFRY
jgi:hypothetical protein